MLAATSLLQPPTQVTCDTMPYIYTSIKQPPYSHKVMAHSDTIGRFHCVYIHVHVHVCTTTLHEQSVIETRQSKATTPEDKSFFPKRKRRAASGGIWTRDVLHTRQTLTAHAHVRVYMPRTNVSGREAHSYQGPPLALAEPCQARLGWCGKACLEPRLGPPHSASGHGWCGHNSRAEWTGSKRRSSHQRYDGVKEMTLN